MKTQRARRVWAIAALYLLFADRGMATDPETLQWAKFIVRSNRE